MNYITSVTQDRIHNLHSIPCIYQEVPPFYYMKTDAREDLLERYFSSTTFAWLFYLEAPSVFLIPGHNYNYYKKMPFSYVLKWDEL